MAPKAKIWSARTASIARKHLEKSDPTLGAAIKKLETIKPSPQADPYLALLQSIISQQLSVKAADTIANRVYALFPDNIPSSDKLLRKRDLTLHKAGLSRAKVKALKAVASAHQEGRLELADMKTKSNEELIADLTDIWGVGTWTVHMLLMFSLNRADILPVQDVGIQNAIKRIYKINATGKSLPPAMEKIAEPWQPWRSVACRYLWHWLHATPL